VTLRWPSRGRCRRGCSKSNEGKIKCTDNSLDHRPSSSRNLGQSYYRHPQQPGLHFLQRWCPLGSRLRRPPKQRRQRLRHRSTVLQSLRRALDGYHLAACAFHRKYNHTTSSDIGRGSSRVLHPSGSTAEWKLGWSRLCRTVDEWEYLGWHDWSWAADVRSIHHPLHDYQNSSPTSYQCNGWNECQ
jgi:hypothetical protein